jgi:ketosteroid isomerase-like protein
MSATDVDTIRTAYRRFAEHDAAAVFAMLDPQIEWIEGGGGDSPFGTFVGPDAVASGVFAVIGANFDEYHADPIEFVDEGDRVVVTGRFTGTNKSGAELDTGFEHVFVMRDGKVVRFENRPDDAAAWAAGWTSAPTRSGRLAPASRTQRSTAMILATTKFEDYDRFMEIFSTKGAEKRRQHGCKGAQIFRDPNEDDQVWVIFDWDETGWKNFVSDPAVPGIMQEAGHKGKPQVAAVGGRLDA